MKKIALILLAIMVCLSVIALDKGRRSKKQDDRYCAKMKDGIMKVEHEGEVLSADAVLADGTTVKTDGTIIRKDGTRISLKEGECVNKDGTMSDLPAGKKSKTKK